MSNDRPLRMFVAASVPPEQLEWLAEATAELRERWPAARWAAIESQHITLKFLGATPPDRLEAVESVCRSVAAGRAPGSLRLGGVGVFPSLRRVRVLWVGLEDPSTVLPSVAGDLDAALEPLGYRTEARAYTPHLTLARFREPVRIEAVPELPEAPAPFPLASIGLWRSHLSPRGARYEQLAELPLGHAP